ncbi:peptidoglycan DD-metalloendopeptidase family protein, partial [Candidatus Babeliales bacterium]|nr:peptidoglycan DD-metalloendopeptidase family protein [Candidatus Babeliales bacterium]
NLLDQQIESAHLSLEAIVVEIETIGLERSSINKELVDLEEEALDQKLVLQKAIRSSYLMRRKSLVETLIGSDSLAEFMSHLEYLDRVQYHISVGIQTINDLKGSLAIKKAVLEDKNERLSEIQSSKILEEESLQIQIHAKQGILQDLKFNEVDYQKRLESARAEQQAVSNEIANLLRSTPKKAVPSGELKLAWPVPRGVITATFQDQAYYRRFGITHNAIDIAVPQGTPIKSPAAGTVTKIKDGGSGLSYMVVNHDNGLATVYLHLSGFAVSTGAYVAQGQVIGYTGGTPGTPGAGWLTTGPHLHFEVWYNSQVRNPLAYLI